jgi:hypothetical protein
MLNERHDYTEDKPVYNAENKGCFTCGSPDGTPSRECSNCARSRAIRRVMGRVVWQYLGPRIDPRDLLEGRLAQLKEHLGIA